MSDRTSSPTPYAVSGFSNTSINRAWFCDHRSGSRHNLVRHAYGFHVRSTSNEQAVTSSSVVYSVSAYANTPRASFTCSTFRKKKRRYRTFRPIKNFHVFRPIFAILQIKRRLLEFSAILYGSIRRYYVNLHNQGEHPMKLRLRKKDARIVLSALMAIKTRPADTDPEEATRRANLIDKIVSRYPSLTAPPTKTART